MAKTNKLTMKYTYLKQTKPKQKLYKQPKKDEHDSKNK